MVVLASQGAAAFRLRADPDPQKTWERLARLLNEGPSGGSVLTKAECDALPVSYGGSTIDAANCGDVTKWSAWPTAEGYCLDGWDFDGTKSNAESVCQGKFASAKLFAPANDAERCVTTHYHGLGTSQCSALTLR